MKEKILEILEKDYWPGYNAVSDHLLENGIKAGREKIKKTLQELKADGKVWLATCFEDGKFRGKGWFLK